MSTLGFSLVTLAKSTGLQFSIVCDPVIGVDGSIAESVAQSVKRSIDNAPDARHRGESSIRKISQVNLTHLSYMIVGLPNLWQEASSRLIKSSSLGLILTAHLRWQAELARQSISQLASRLRPGLAHGIGDADG